VTQPAIRLPPAREIIAPAQKIFAVRETWQEAAASAFDHIEGAKLRDLAGEVRRRHNFDDAAYVDIG
jgi:hypothetical protein